MAKNNNDLFWKVMRPVLTIVLVLLTVAVAYGSLCEKVENNTMRNCEQEVVIGENEKDIIGVKKDIYYIRGRVDDIFNAVQRGKNEQGN